MTSLTLSHQIHDKHTIIDMFARYGLLVASHIAMRNPFSQSKQR